MQNTAELFLKSLLSFKYVSLQLSTKYYQNLN